MKSEKTRFSAEMLSSSGHPPTLRRPVGKGALLPKAHIHTHCCRLAWLLLILPAGLTPSPVKYTPSTKAIELTVEPTARGRWGGRSPPLTKHVTSLLVTDIKVQGRTLLGRGLKTKHGPSSSECGSHRTLCNLMRQPPRPSLMEGRPGMGHNSFPNLKPGSFLGKNKHIQFLIFLLGSLSEQKTDLTQHFQSLHVLLSHWPGLIHG